MHDSLYALKNIENIIFIRQIHKIPQMLPQYRMIRDFDLYENTYEEMNRFSAPVFHKDDFLKDTQDN